MESVAAGRLRPRLAAAALASLLALLPASRVWAQPGPVWGRHGAVASAERHASDAGIEIMKAGGNAVDAAAAVGFALAVTHPAAGNLGGGGFMLIRMANGGKYFLDFREEAPGAARPNLYLDAHGNYIPNSSITGYRAIGVPGSVAGLAAAVQRFGRLGLARDMAPAIRLASHGYVLDHNEAGFLHASNLALFPDSRRVFQRNGHFYHTGETFRQPELAATLRLIAAHGPDAFYRGRIARQLTRFMKRHGGLLTMADLAAYQAKWRAPLQGDYHGYHIVTSPLPSSGGVVLLEMLNMLAPTNYQRGGLLAASTIHFEAEAMRRAFADRSKFLGDPDFVKPPIARLLSPAYARERWASVSPGRATPSAQVEPASLASLAPESTQTTHFSIVDAAGDAVSCTTTLNNWFGSGVTAGHLGFLLNDEMDDFTSKPGVPNMFGLIQGVANQIEPHKRPLSSMTPTIVTRDHRLAIVLGSPGGPRIITAVFEVLTDMIDFGLNVQQAVDQPRFHLQWMPDVLYLNRIGISPDTQDLLRKMGYHLQLRGPWSDVEAISVDSRTGALWAATDPRADGAARTW